MLKNEHNRDFNICYQGNIKVLEKGDCKANLN